MSLPPAPEGIDAGVWAELPEDIRRELFRDALRPGPPARVVSPPTATSATNVVMPHASSSADELAVYFASLDPAIRSQALLDTPSAQLLQMPPELRGEAEFLRFQHAFDLQNRPSLPHHPLIYPQRFGGDFAPTTSASAIGSRKPALKEALHAKPLPPLLTDVDSAKWALEQFSRKPSSRLENVLTTLCLSETSKQVIVDLLVSNPQDKQLHEIKFLGQILQAQPDARKRVVLEHPDALFMLLSRVGQEKTRFKRQLDLSRAILTLMDAVLVGEEEDGLAARSDECETLGLRALSRLLADEDCPDREFDLAKKVAKRLAKNCPLRVEVLLGDFDHTCLALAKEVATVSLKLPSVTLAEQRFLRVITTIKALQGRVVPTPELDQVWDTLEECIKLSTPPAAEVAPSPAPPAALVGGEGALPHLQLGEAAGSGDAAMRDAARHAMSALAATELRANEDHSDLSDDEGEEGNGQGDGGDGGEEEEHSEDEDDEDEPELFQGSHEIRNAFSQMMDAIAGGGEVGALVGGAREDEEDEDEDEEEDDEDDEDDEEGVGGLDAPGDHAWMRRMLPPAMHNHHFHFMHPPPATAASAVPGSAAAASTSKHSNVLRYLCIIEAFFEANEDNEPVLDRFGSEHSTLLNELVSEQQSLLTSSLECLVSKPGLRKVLNFNNKRAFFKLKMRQRHTAETRSMQFRTRGLKLNIRRNHVFDDSYSQLGMKSVDEIKAGVNVTFQGEEAVDVGGPTKEWFSILIRDMFKPGYALFKKSENAANAYQPDPRSSMAIGPDHLNLFKFAGRMIGKALSMNQLVEVHFTRSFYKHLLGGHITLADLESLDMEYYKSLMKLLEMEEDVACLELHFTTDIEQFGERHTVELKPNGSLIKVTEESKHEYVKLAAHHKMSISIQKQIDSFVQGFYELVPKELIAIFSPQEMELLLSGTPAISVADLKRHTEYHGGYTADTKQIEWFWDTMHHFGQEQRAKFLMFVTGTSQVPLDGFANLSGMRGNIQRFSIHRGPASDSTLPSSHTCFHQLILPQYPSKEVLREKLLLAVTECSEGFGFV
ncbi:hypothetical protein BASA81_012880 [Batrachochytrium salamandrivorans]|nr:hypothetical protein BASA81_012880 [Batrachochytrium salamandrivorans]